MQKKSPDPAVKNTETWKPLLGHAEIQRESNAYLLSLQSILDAEALSGPKPVSTFDRIKNFI
jgi:hypothetical protein